jgi:predicted nucleic acid-binding protein
MKIIIADNSTLITLLDTNNASLLFELFEEIIITDEVYEEITYNLHHKDRVDSYLLSNQFKLIAIEHNEMYEMLRKRLDAGESESIALAKKLQLPLIIDERKGRKIAKSMGVTIIGFVGIVLKLLEKKIITKSRAIKIVHQVEENDFRLSGGLKGLIYDFE